MEILRAIILGVSIQEIDGIWRADGRELDVHAVCRLLNAGYATKNSDQLHVTESGDAALCTEATTARSDMLKWLRERKTNERSKG